MTNIHNSIKHTLNNSNLLSYAIKQNIHYITQTHAKIKQVKFSRFQNSTHTHVTQAWYVFHVLRLAGMKVASTKG